ncbi:hypothetical protein A5888_003200 [Enterococcus sp. 9E7_DIV0242]|uniref:DUF998 domain-containing protein n=2 Tax=Candidatus Enterococcus clewellii TaxID=1834193 RepID=A0A242JZK0_9ENTE|nr:hypothetical protein A5888_003849 [Enterococcus sp. 9E7_DIV0242]
MMKKESEFQLPEEILQEIDLEQQNEMDLDVQTGKLTIRKKDKGAMEGQTISLRGFLLPTIIATIIFFLFFYLKEYTYVPLVGRPSIGELVNTVGVLTGIITLIVTFIGVKKGRTSSQAKNLYWRNFPALVISFLIILLLGSLFLFRLLGYMFPGISFDLFTATLFFFVIMTVINYLMIYMVLELSPMLLTNILTIVIVGGALGAMLTNREKQWWQHNFSFLGTVEATSRWQFNLTLILSAVLMIALIDYLFVNLKQKYSGIKLTILRWLLILVALNLGGVGAFPYQDDSIYGVIHNQVAANLVYLIIILIIGMHWLLPKVTKEFQVTSYVIMGLLVLTVVLFQGVHYFSLTAFELVSFLIAFVWLLLLFQYLQKLMLENTEREHITIYLENTGKEIK